MANFEAFHYQVISSSINLLFLKKSEYQLFIGDFLTNFCYFQSSVPGSGTECYSDLVCGLNNCPPTDPGGFDCCTINCPTNSAADSADCISEYERFQNEGNLQGFYDFCVNEDTADPLRSRCSRCCDSAATPFLWEVTWIRGGVTRLGNSTRNGSVQQS